MTSLDVTSQYLVFKITHFVELNIRYQHVKVHWPKLSGSNFMRVGGKHPPPPNLQAFKKPNPYKVKGPKSRQINFADISIIACLYKFKTTKCIKL